MSRSRGCVLLFASAALGFQACKSDSSTSPDDTKLVASAVTPTKVEGIVGTIAPFSPGIKVVEARTGRPVANVSVHFRDASVSSPETVTDGDGIATAGEWRFSARAGTEQLSALIGGQLAVQFTAILTHDAALNILTSDGGERVALAGSRVAGIGLQVVDQFGNGVAGVQLTFSVNSGTLAGSGAISGPGGGVVVDPWILDNRPGTGELTIVADGVKPVVFRGVGIDSASLEWYELQEIRVPGAPALTGTDLPKNRFGITPFNNCMCGGVQHGFFIETTTPTSSSIAPSQIGGRFELDGANLKLASTSYRLKSHIEGDKVYEEKFHWLSELTYEIRTWVFVRNKSP